MVGSDGLEPSMTEVGKFTVSCNSRYANYPLKLPSLSQCHTTDPTSVSIRCYANQVWRHGATSRCRAPIGGTDYNRLSD